MCSTKKITYFSKQTADNTLARIQEKAKMNKNFSRWKPSRSYHCPICGYFHLTSQT